MTLKEYIFREFTCNGRGVNSPIKRIELLGRVRDYHWGGLDVTDREMRQAYEDLPICGSSKGLYLPETQQEIDEQIKLHQKKIMSYWRKIKVLKKYKIESDPIQKELFYGGINDQY